MRFMQTYARGRGGLVAALVALTASLVVFAGAAATGHAAATPAVMTTFTVLNDDGPTQPGLVTAGKNIGYEITVTNKGSSVANHLLLTESISGAIDPDPAASEPVYQRISGGISCGTISGLTVSCTLEKLDVGATVDVVVLYKTDPAAVPAQLPGPSSVTNNTVVAFDSQTNGAGNRKTLTFNPTRFFADESLGLAETLSRGGNDKIDAGGPGQISSVTMPDTFVNGIAFVAAKLQNASVKALAGCSKCPKLGTQITIPASTPFTLSGPFYDGTTQKAFAWSLTLPGSLVPNGFKLTGVYHTDSAGNVTLILPCSDSSSPLTNTGICLSTLGQDSSTKTITATGLAFTNGTYQFG
jgi:hypothetical protein